MTSTPTARPADGLRRVVLRSALVLAVVATAISGAAATSHAAAPVISIVVTQAPSGVTRGNNVLYTLTVTNKDAQSVAQQVTVSDPAPGTSFPVGTTIVSATPELGTCQIAPDARSVTCPIGSLAPLAHAYVKVVVKTTTDPGYAGTSFTNKAQVSLNEGGNDKETPAQHIDTDSNEVTTQLFATDSPTDAGGYIETGCNAANPTDPSLIATNPNVGSGNLQATQACVPQTGGGTGVTVSESARAPGSPGFSETSTICVPVPGGDCSAPLTFAASAPATFGFKLSPLLPFPKGWSYKNAVVYHDNLAVTALCNADGSVPAAAPGNACKFSVTQDTKTKIVTIIVKSLSNGSWNFG